MKLFTKNLSSSGFSLIELLVVVSIVAVLSALAAPALSELVAKNQTESIAAQLNTLLVKAQTESVRRGGFARLEKFDGTPGSNPCSSLNDWSCGVRLMADSDKDGTFELVLDELSIPAGLTLLNVSDVSTSAGGDASKIPFDRWGRSANATQLAFVQTKGGFQSANRAVCLESTGRVHTIKSPNLTKPCP